MKLRLPPPCDETLGLVCLDKATPGRTVWRMVPDDHTSNATGVVQGGFLASLADTAMATAVITASRAQELRVVAHSIEMKISFLRPAQLGSELWCTGAVVRSGQRVSFAEFDIRDTACDALVAKGSSSFLLVPREPAVRGEME